MNTIIVCGQEFDIGTRVVPWNAPNGLNAYDKTSYVSQDADGNVNLVSGARYSARSALNRNPSLAQLKAMVSQFFLHHSGLYRATDTFNVLHKERRLSCHFILDDDGIIYQTLDLKEKAWHGGKCNARSVGIEIDSRADADRFPQAYNELNQAKHGVGPRRVYRDSIQGEFINGYEYNDAQYRTLIKLAIGLMKIFPIIGTNPDFPRTLGGQIEKEKIKNPKKHLGFICHFHANARKTDPVAFDFERFLSGAKNKNPDQPSTLRQSEIPEPQPVGPPTIEIIKPDIKLETWWDIQAALVELGYNPGALDGVFGKKTRKALRSFQAASGLVVDGIWGPNTKKEMKRQLEKIRNA